MVNVINFHMGAAPSFTDVDLAEFLEDKIAQLVNYTYVDTAGAAATYILEDDGRVSPIIAGTSVAADSVRLVDWQTINMGETHVTAHRIQLTVLYLKDSPGKYP
ncbi:unnamed protein product [marine sediment metagenome]|uniref:Uncharacterized protein n=1 Tax=marine sediment metagenome TaxID=412755 RepID=X0YZ52_9ZZZZ